MDETKALRELKKGSESALAWFIDRYAAYAGTIVSNILGGAMGQPDREIFLRHYYYCQSVDAIAAEMDMNPSTVKSRLRRGREKLKAVLTEELMA